MKGKNGARAAAGLLLLALLSQQVTAGPLMAVDFGGESIRVSVVKPGRNPISVVLNEASKRKTSAQVAFVDKERLLGEEAATLSVRFPDRVYARTRDLLGRYADDESLQGLLASSHLPYKVVPYSKERPTAAIQSHSGQIYSAEELVASMLYYARSITEAATEGAAVLDCVITVPAFWGPNQRQALIDAAKISGINVLALVNTHAAAALQYGIERNFENQTQLVVFYDMGATSTECALVEFSTFRVKEGGIMKTYGQFEVKDVAWDASLGSEALDMLLLEHFADEFMAANPGLDPRSSPKAIAKLKRQVKRTKEVLSANSFAPISVEELLSGQDFRSRIARDDFERLAARFLSRAAEPLRQILERNKVSVPDLSAVELLGGGSRVPAVKAALSETLGGRQLDMHMDADEAVVLGAGLFAANLSTTFRLRKFGMVDGITYPIAYQLEQPSNVVLDEGLEAHFQPKALLPRLKRLPARRMVPLPNITSVDTLQAHLSFDVSDPAIGFPPGITSEHLATFEISGIKEVMAKYSEPVKPSLHFRADDSGIISLEKGEAIVEVEEEYTIKIPVTPPENDNATSAENSTASDAEESLDLSAEDLLANETDSNATAKQPPLPVYKDVTKTRKKTVRVPLTIGGPGFARPGLTTDSIKASKRVLDKLAQAERAKKEASKQKNELEAYIIAFRGRLDSDDAILAVTTGSQRSTFAKELDAAEEWLYSEGEHEPAAVFVGKMKELRKTGDAFELRAKELKALPKAAKNAEDFLRISRQAVGGWATTKPWLNTTEVEDLTTQLDELESWLKSELQKQQELQPHQDPSLQSSDVEAREDAIRRLFNKLKAKKKPKPPPAPKPSETATNETAEVAAEGGAKAEDEETRKQDEGTGEELRTDTEEAAEHDEL